jgi:DNA-directed RNA polymerase subunit RPC12/RpoP
MADKKAMLHFNCPQCTSPLETPMAMAGQRYRCPFCQFVFQAPKESRRPVVDQGYALREGESTNVQDENEVSIVCFRCGTRMYARSDQVGQTILCPDCETPNVVTLPRRIAKSKTPVVGETYEIHEGVPPTWDDHTAAKDAMVRVTCPRCDTLAYLPQGQIGHDWVCPDCKMTVLVPRPADPIEIDAMARAGEGYAFAKWEGVDPLAKVESRLPQWDPEREPPPGMVRRPIEPPARLAALPRLPFWVGTFSFPFQPEARACGIVIFGWAMLSLSLLYLGDLLYICAIYAFFAMALHGLGVICGLGLFGYSAGAALAIVQDTADGCEPVRHWPDMMITEWLGCPFYVLVAICASAAPGAGIAWLCAQNGYNGEIVVLISLFLLFPFVLLSMLEIPSVFGLFSWAVFRTVWSAGGAWAELYVASAVLWILAYGLLRVAFAMTPFCGIVVTAAVFTFVWFVYFRLLGRLALCCADVARKKGASKA